MDININTSIRAHLDDKHPLLKRLCLKHNSVAHVYGVSFPILSLSWKVD